MHYSDRNAGGRTRWAAETVEAEPGAEFVIEQEENQGK
jgi:hypothetical protein